MITIKPSKETYHCNCECGAEFFAFNKDINQYDIIIYDRFAYNSKDVSPILDSIKCDVIKCPFCNNFVIIDDNGYNLKYNDIRNDFDKNNFNKITYKIVNTSDIPEIIKKFPQLKDNLNGL